ncbi:MAG: hypothetical protein LBP54_02525 [Campylobacteraceae bacterium]|jgi:hypothetical protein|nr:hypothetical protein [Campylobacteraceae bacterium]
MLLPHWIYGWFVYLIGFDELLNLGLIDHNGNPAGLTNIILFIFDIVIIYLLISGIILNYQLLKKWKTKK